MHKTYDALPEWRVDDARRTAEQLKIYSSYEVREGAAQEMSFLCDCFSELRTDYESLKKKFSEMQSQMLRDGKRLNVAIKMLHGNCSACKNYSAYHRKGKCKNCRFDNANPACLREYQDDCWEWKGCE